MSPIAQGHQGKASLSVSNMKASGGNDKTENENSCLLGGAEDVEPSSSIPFLLQANPSTDVTCPCAR